MTPVPHSPATAASLAGYTTATLAAIVHQADDQLTNPNPAWHVTRATLEDIRRTGAEILHHRETAGYRVKQHHNGVPGWSVLDPTGCAVEAGLSYEFACHVAARLRAAAG
jgi:hypothetical protein